MKKMIVTCLGLITLASCNLSKEIDIELPQYAPQPVVECYLIPGQRYELLLTHSNSFFDPLSGENPALYLESILEKGAEVMIIHNGDTVRLQEKIELNSATGFISNYSNSATVPDDHINGFDLVITLSDGSVITSTTRIPEPVSIDSIRVEYANAQKTRATVFVYHTDDRSTADYYRRMIHVASLDSIAEQDYTTDDRINQTAEVAYGTFYEREDREPVTGDTLIFTLMHITGEFHEFFESKENANAANGNPFGQPGQIRSNVSGAANPIGIFTGFVPRRDTLIFR